MRGLFAGRPAHGGPVAAHLAGMMQTGTTLTETFTRMAAELDGVADDVPVDVTTAGDVRAILAELEAAWFAGWSDARMVLAADPEQADRETTGQLAGFIGHWFSATDGSAADGCSACGARPAAGEREALFVYRHAREVATAIRARDAAEFARIPERFRPPEPVIAAVLTRAAAHEAAAGVGPHIHGA